MVLHFCFVADQALNFLLQLRREHFVEGRGDAIWQGAEANFTMGLLIFARVPRGKVFQNYMRLMSMNKSQSCEHTDAGEHQRSIDPNSLYAL